ncbi:MAG TPA: hypothetical protein VHA74_02340 [Candidatus Dojkabacteria bacterium]|nr:hypothetical protein [Candidatus Dojkabacteria bacterium]
MQTFINNSVEQQKASKGEWLHQLPPELVGVLPQNIWVSLSIEQKKDLLRQHNLLDKYNDIQEHPVAESTHVVSTEELPPIETSTQANNIESPALPVEAPKVSEVPEVMTVDKGMAPEKEQFAKSVESLKAKEQARNQENAIAEEDKARIAQEQASNVNKKNNVKTSIGYKISDDTVTNAVTLSHNGNTDDGRTWAAALVRKIFAIID